MAEIKADTAVKFLPQKGLDGKTLLMQLICKKACKLEFFSQSEVMIARFLALFLVMIGLCQAAELKVATLHPLLTDLVKQVGGENVEVVELVSKNTNLHSFQPSPKQMRMAAGCSIVFASGKGLETYLNDLADSLGKSTKIVEVGRTIPSVKVDAEQKLFMCCPNHSKSAIDPHWWHSPNNMRRAVDVISEELIEKDPKNESKYEANAKEAIRKLNILNGWAKQQISRIPRDQRILVTAHAAFGYFCKEFGFKTIPIQGVSSEDEGSPSYLNETITKIRELKVPAVFPEDNANAKILTEISRSTGAKPAPALSADGTNKKFKGYEDMFRYNVTTIVNALAPQGK